jgi:hypothetical protein
MSKIPVVVTWRATVKTNARPAMEKQVAVSLREYIRYYSDPKKPILEIDLTALTVKPGADRQKGVKLARGHNDHGADTGGVPVLIKTNGGQGLECLMSIPGFSDETVRKIIEEGPYTRAPKVAKEPIVPTAAPVAESMMDLPLPLPNQENQEVATDAPPTVEDMVKETPPTPEKAKPILSAHERLVQAGVSKEEVSRLKATLATIFQREFEKHPEEVDTNTLQVSVEKITKAIMEHMGLPSNAAGNYRGIIGSFYYSRIALFAVKTENALEGVVYTDWAFDCPLVYDFIGGKDQLAHLSREREAEVKRRIADKAKPQPQADEVVEAVDQLLPDASILDLAMKVLEGRRQAEGELALALANLQLLKVIVAEAERQLRETKAQLVDAERLVAEKETAVKQFVLDPEVLNKIREAKQRLDQLASDLGI